MNSGGGSKKMPPKSKKPVKKEVWNWEWRKLKAAKEGKEIAPTEAEGPEPGEESKFQYPLICVSQKKSINI
jgi:hypothetical protein